MEHKYLVAFLVKYYIEEELIFYKTAELNYKHDS